MNAGDVRVHTVRWSAGGIARITGVSGVNVSLESERPFPPGTPAEGTLSVDAGPAQSFTLKVAGSRKVAEGVWEVKGRLLSATSALTALFARATGG